MSGLGDTLREARQQLGLSLDQAERATKIRKKYLAALETEDFDALPAPVYVKGFLRTYARYLGLDPLPLLALYPHNAEPVALEATPRISKTPLFSLGAGFVTIFILIVVAGALAYMFWRGQAASSPEYVGNTEPTQIAAMNPDATPTMQIEPLPTNSPTSTTITPIPTRVVSPIPTPTPTAEIPQEIELPSLIGMSYAEAQKLLDGLELKVSKQEEWNATVPIGVIYTQTPSEGQHILPGETVTLTVSKGREKAVVPNVVGMEEEKAKEAIIHAKLQLSRWGVNYQGHDVLPDEILNRVCIGCVLSVTPAPGTLVELGTVINMAVRQD